MYEIGVLVMMTIKCYNNPLTLIIIDDELYGHWNVLGPSGTYWDIRSRSEFIELGWKVIEEVK